MDKKTVGIGEGRPGGDEGLKWGVRRRLEFIDFRLYWDGHLNRRDLIVRFGISAQQASTDIDRYMSIAPANMTYDRTAKTFVRGVGYDPVFVAGFADRFLLQLQGLQLGWIDKEQTWFDDMPPAEVVRLRHRALDDAILRPVLDGIRERRVLRVDYSPMSGKPMGPRTIAPHALAFSDGRWHVRCWNAEHGDFRDFTLNRMSSVKDMSPSVIDPQHDFEWQLMGDMILVPNPQLSEVERRSVMREYDFSGDSLIWPTRLALVFYVKAQHNLDLDWPSVKPTKQHLVLVNGSELDDRVRAARTMSAVALTSGAVK